MATNLTNGTQPAATDLDRPLYVPIKRRSFFMYAGATAGATALVLAGCKKDNDNPGTSLVNVGSGDAGVLNYAYALEQLEAAFYTQVRQGGYYTGTAITAAEKQVLDDLYYHEVIHRDFLRAAITAAGATPIPGLTPNFSSINFADRTSIFTTARAFEDLGVQAYNGAGRYITNPGYLFIAGKIVSIEARHAALIRDFITEGTFVDSNIVDTTSQERSMEPSAVASVANQYLADGSKLDVSGIR